MPKKKPGMTPEEQRKRFDEEVRRLADAGELNPTDADAKLDRLVRKAANPEGVRESNSQPSD